MEWSQFAEGVPTELQSERIGGYCAGMSRLARYSSRERNMVRNRK